jgi:hypothetical protein
MRLPLLVVFGLLSSTAWAQAPDATDKPASGAKADAKSSAESAADVALLEGVVRAKARDKDAAEEVAKAYARIGQICDAKGDFKAAADARERLVSWFDAQGLPRDGSVPAAIAAHARLTLLEPAIRKEMARVLLDGGKAHSDARKQLEAWHDSVAAQLPLLGKPAKAGKTLSLVELLAKIAEYKAPAPARQAGLEAGRLLMALSIQTAALAALEPEATRPPLVEQSKIYRDEAARIWELHWREADVPGQRDSVALEIRKQLSVIKPAEFPPLDQKTDEQLSPQQQEASKLASLAQRSTNPSLKVKYLEKALALDPANAQLKEMLRAAIAERDGAQTPKP